MDEQLFVVSASDLLPALIFPLAKSTHYREDVCAVSDNNKMQLELIAVRYLAYELQRNLFYQILYWHTGETR